MQLLCIHCTRPSHWLCITNQFFFTVTKNQFKRTIWINFMSECILCACVRQSFINELYFVYIQSYKRCIGFMERIYNTICALFVAKWNRKSLLSVGDLLPVVFLVYDSSLWHFLLLHCLRIRCVVSYVRVRPCEQNTGIKF